MSALGGTLGTAVRAVAEALTCDVSWSWFLIAGTATLTLEEEETSRLSRRVFVGSRSGNVEAIA
jgi:hypothetical protein